ncbi:MAG TPA: hypothetical protein VFT29_16810 [Gemmatimonadaceae bacterium]|nr:hypothetical protein [Gemmatimonadaceae bacterium]
MAIYRFSLNTTTEARQAGVIHSPSFDEALKLVSARMTVTKGDTLEIGVAGFPPAHYECVESLLDGSVFWMPGRLAA